MNGTSALNQGLSGLSFRRIGSKSKEFVLDKRIAAVLNRVHAGNLTIELSNGLKYFFGDSNSSLHAHWHIHNCKVFSRILKEGSLGLGESYMDGWWDIEDDRIDNFMGIILANALWEDVQESLLLRISSAFHRMLTSPLRLVARKANVIHHYDLGNSFYKLMLDDSMTYSCGYQLTPADSLYEMQQQKYALIAKKLKLERGGRLIDIGCGWGGMIDYATSHFSGIHATGVTLSKEQCDYASQQLTAANAEVLLQDFHDIQGTFDFVVSIGMFEHVGHASYRRFMEKARNLLSPAGLGLLHTIAVTDPPSIKQDAWTERYIFPGYRLPRLEEIVSEMQRVGLVVNHVENLRPHYAQTLKRWRKNITANQKQIRSLSTRFDTRFLRMWNYYLQGAEASFRYGTTQLYQVLFSHGSAKAAGL